MKIKYIFYLIVITLIVGCKTYTIPVDSFKDQMVNATQDNMTSVEVNNPLFNTGHLCYSANAIEELKVWDKDGNALILNVSPAIEMRVTKSDGKKQVLYFDTVILENDTLKGSNSRFIQSLSKQIPISDIVTVEIQDGGKNFNYQE